jgi:hypothetical protein
MEKAIKEVLSEGKNGVKLHSAVQKSFGKYFVEVAPIEDMADLPQDVGEWTLTGMEAWKNDPGGELPAVFKARLVKWSGGTDEEAGLPSHVSSGKKAGKTITAAVPGLDEDEDDMEDLASEFGGMAVSSMNRVQALEDVRIQGVSLPRILVLSASLELGSVVATGEVAGGLLHYCGNPAMMEKARQSRKGGVDTLSKIITEKNRIALSSHFSALSREYTAKGWVEEVALISAFWTETMAHFDGNSKAMFGYLKEYFREFKGRGLPLAFSMPTAWRVLGQEGFAKAGLSDEQTKELREAKDAAAKAKREAEEAKAELKKLSTAVRGMQGRLDRGLDQGGPDDDKPGGGKRAFAFKGKCNICGKRGHMARDCPDNPAADEE